MKTTLSKFFKRNGRKFFLLSGIFLFATLAIAWRDASTLRIVIIGDSTVCTYATSKYPQTGWGQVLGYFFNSNTVTIINKAIGGRSSRSFYTGRWADTKALLQEGDYLFIQFGHNDRDWSDTTRYADTAQYRYYLTQYVTEARALGVIPVFISPMNMNTWNGTTLREVFTESANDYHLAMQRLATALDVPFIDLEQKSKTLFQSLGQAYITRYLFFTLAAGEYANYPDGNTDGTHFQEMGAINMAKLIAEGISELSSDSEMSSLAAVLAPQYQLTVLSNKDGAGTITESNTYPATTPITIKILRDSGETFLNWVDNKNSSVSTDSLYFFTMPDSAVTFTAVFNGGQAVSVCDNSMVCQKPVSQKIRVNRNVSNGTITLSADEQMQAITISDLSGKQIYNNRVQGQVVVLQRDIFHGSAIAKITTSRGFITAVIQN